LRLSRERTRLARAHKRAVGGGTEIIAEEDSVDARTAGRLPDVREDGPLVVGGVLGEDDDVHRLARGVDPLRKRVLIRPAQPVPGPFVHVDGLGAQPFPDLLRSGLARGRLRGNDREEHRHDHAEQRQQHRERASAARVAAVRGDRDERSHTDIICHVEQKGYVEVR
jgi:hypothetical protein